MLTVPASLSQAFETLLSQRNVPISNAASFARFDEKLQSKGQADMQRQQARRSNSIYRAQPDDQRS